MSGEKQVGSGGWENTGMLGKVGGLLRYQVLLTLFALDVLRLGAGHINIRGIGTVLK